MTITEINNNNPEKTNLQRQKLATLFSAADHNDSDDSATSFSHSSRRNSDSNSTSITSPTTTTYNTSYYSNPNSASSSPYNNLMSPWSQPSPYSRSPWTHQAIASPLPYEHQEDGEQFTNMLATYGVVGSLFREEGHVYSLATAGDLLYTGSDSKNVRVWKKLQEFSGFKSSSGFVKAIVVFKDKVFTGHHDGRIRVWRFDRKNNHKRVGSLPTTRDLLMKSINPKNYVEVRRRRNVPWVKHYDAVSCLGIDSKQGLLYSSSWDKTLKVWRISNSKCLESIEAHDDAVNSVAVAADVGLVFTGSADGTVKSWRRELVGNSTSHVLVDALIVHDHAVTSLAVTTDLVKCSTNDEPHYALYAGSSDGLVSFWESGGGDGRRFMAYGGVLRGHKMAVLCLAAGGDRLVMSGSADGSICVWRREGGGVHSCLAVLRGHGGPVKCLSVEEDKTTAARGEEGGRRWAVYSGSLDKSVKVWRVWERSPVGLKVVEEECGGGASSSRASGSV